jgi:hypothetical protein
MSVFVEDRYGAEGSNPASTALCMSSLALRWQAARPLAAPVELMGLARHKANAARSPSSSIHGSPQAHGTVGLPRCPQLKLGNA